MDLVELAFDLGVDICPSQATWPPLIGVGIQPFSVSVLSLLYLSEGEMEVFQLLIEYVLLHNLPYPSRPT